MKNLTDELKTKLCSAKSEEEAAALLKDAGVDTPLAERLWTELKHKREADGKELSLDELESVSGGIRDWVTEGCAATVEWDSDCWGVDGGCLAIHYTYSREPTTDDRCPKCGARVYLEGEYGVSTGFLQGYNWKEFICRNCGPYKVKDDGTIF